MTIDNRGSGMKEEAHWSYIEILAVVIVLGIVSMKAAPRFTQARQDFRIGRLTDGLQQMRFQLDLYKAQHEGNLPPTDSFESFNAGLTTRVGQYGPYIRKIPVNPFNNLSTVRFNGPPAGSGSAGWRLDTKTGLFQADDSTIHAGL
jgi:general secretion pathway protein G